jgi:hypothetical protein
MNGREKAVSAICIEKWSGDSIFRRRRKKETPPDARLTVEHQRKQNNKVSIEDGDDKDQRLECDGNEGTEAKDRNPLERVRRAMTYSSSRAKEMLDRSLEGKPN